MPAVFPYNLTKNLTAHLTHNLCAVLPKITTGNYKKIKISDPVYTFCEVFDHIAINNFLMLLVCVIYKIDINQCIIHK